jgi:sugar lactone lactonase YvrE
LKSRFPYLYSFVIFVSMNLLHITASSIIRLSAVLSVAAVGCLGANAQTCAVTTVAGTVMDGFTGNGGPATDARLNQPAGIAVDGAGNVYVSDFANNMVRVISPAGSIDAYVGCGIAGFTGDGNPATNSKLDGPRGLAFDAAGNLYIADCGNNRIRKVSPAGVLSTFAGTGTAGFSGDGGAATAAELRLPYGVKADALGNIYIADLGNNRVRRVDASGNIVTVAGNGAAAFTGDGGPATAAALRSPADMVPDNAGNLYIADMDNQDIRKVDGAGTITTVAGNNWPGWVCDSVHGTNSELFQPMCVITDAYGNILIADMDNNRVRRLTDAYIIYSVGGTGVAGHSGDGGPATAAELNHPSAIAMDGAGNIYVAEAGDGVVRRFSGCDPSAVAGVAVAAGLQLSPNPATAVLYVAAGVPLGRVSVMNPAGETVFSVVTEATRTDIPIEKLPPGLYLLRQDTPAGETSIRKFIKR